MDKLTLYDLVNIIDVWCHKSLDSMIDFTVKIKVYDDGYIKHSIPYVGQEERVEGDHLKKTLVFYLETFENDKSISIYKNQARYDKKEDKEMVEHQMAYRIIRDFVKGGLKAMHENYKKA